MNDPNATPQTNKHFYDRIAKAYDLIADASERAARQAGIKLLELATGQAVLEVGFGTGNEIIDLANLVGPKGRVAGIDISTGMLEVAQHKIRERISAAANVDLICGDARKLPYADESFDAVYTSFTLELFDPNDIPVVLAEAKRVLKPGGKISIVSMATVEQGHRASALEHTYIWMHRHFPHLVDCRTINVDTLLAAAGFDVIAGQHIEIWTMPVRVAVAEANKLSKAVVV